MIEAILNAGVEVAKGGAEILPVDFGKFAVKERLEREGCNPATGEAMTIVAGRKLALTPAKAVIEWLTSGAGEGRAPRLARDVQEGRLTNGGAPNSVDA